MLKKILKWAGIIFAVVVVVFFGWRVMVAWEKQKTDAVVAKIHSTKLALADVLGERLPPVPENPDATVEGVDANKNGIRDDVELAIFKEYPNSGQTRAVLLQYALALQMEMTQPIVNEGTVIAAVQEESRAYLCVGEILSRSDMNEYITKSDTLRSFVKEKQLNTEARKKARTDFYEKIGSHESLDRICDIDYSTLPN